MGKRFMSLFGMALFLVMLMIGQTQAATVGVNWQVLTSPAGANSDLSKVVYASQLAKFVAVGGSTVVTSQDGINWVDQSAVANVSLLSELAWSGTQFVAVGSFDTVYTSPDGVTWSRQAFSLNMNFYDVVWSPSLAIFVGIGTAGTIVTSPDGITWTQQSSGTTDALFAIDWSPALNKFVVAGNQGTTLTSPDGITWTPQVSGVTSRVQTVVWGGTKFVALGTITVGSAFVLTSPDGIVWTQQQNINDTNMFGATWAGNQFIVGASGAWTSPDGITWTLYGNGLTGGILTDFAWDGTQLVAVGAWGTLMRSVGTPVPAAANVSLSLNVQSFRTGSLLTLTRSMIAGTPATNADIYVGLQLPDGTLLVKQPNGSFTTAITPLQANVPVTTATDIPFTYTFTGTEPSGTYTWLAAFMQPGTLNVIGTMASQTFTFAP